MGRKLSFQADDDSGEIVKRYEQYLAGDASGYFDVEELERIVEYYLFRGRTSDGTSVIDFGLRLHPNNTALQTKRAKTYLLSGNFQKAYRLLESLTHTNEYEVKILKLEAALRMKFTAEADKLTNSIFADEQSDLDNVAYDVAMVYISSALYKRAITILEKGDAYRSDNSDLLFELAFCYEHEQMFDKAIDTYNRILDIDPYTSEAWFNLGQLHFAMNEHAKALYAYDFVVTINDNDSLACLQKAHCTFHLGEYKAAIALYLEYEQMSPDNWQTYLFIAECYERLEDYRMGIEYYRKSFDLNADNFEATTGLAVCMLELEEYAESIYFSRLALQLQEDAADAWVYLAEGLTGIEEYDDALIAYLNSIRIEPNHPDTLMAIANLYMERADFEQAVCYFRQAQLLDDSLENIQLLLAIAYYKANDGAAAALALSNALQTNLDASVLFLELCPEAAMDNLFADLV